MSLIIDYRACSVDQLYYILYNDDEYKGQGAYTGPKVQAVK